MQTQVHTVVQGLLAGEDVVWSSFLFDVPMAKQVVQSVEADQAKLILQVGGGWSAPSWSTTALSRKLWETAKVALVVSSEKKEYVHLWLYALSLAWQLDVGELDLSDRAAEAAFHIMEQIAGAEPHGGGEPEAEATEGMRLDWEEEQAELSPDLLYLWNKSKSGERLELREVLSEVPKLKDIPSRAPDNNHRVTNLDKQLKVVQTGLLHGLRMLGFTYMLLQERSDEALAQQVFQQTWKQMCDIYWKVDEQRKESGIPGSTAGTADQLFNKEDLQQAVTSQKIRGYRGMKGYVHPPPPNLYSFRPSSFGKGRKGFGMPRSKGFGFGQSYGQSYGSFRGGFKGYGSLKGKGKG